MKIRSVVVRRHINTILLSHAFTGSDTTSRIHGVGKDRLFRTIASIDDSVIDAIYLANSTPATIKSAESYCSTSVINICDFSIPDTKNFH